MKREGWWPVNMLKRFSNWPRQNFMTLYTPDCTYTSGACKSAFGALESLIGKKLQLSQSQNETAFCAVILARGRLRRIHPIFFAKLNCRVFLILVGIY